MPTPRLRVPYWIAWSVGVLSEFVAEALTRTPPIAPLACVRLAASPMVFDCTKAAQELGLQPRPVRMAIADSVAWLERKGI